MQPSGQPDFPSHLPGLFRQFLESVPDAVIEVDGDGRIVFANARVEEVFGYRPCELIASPVEILIPGELQAAHASSRAAYTERPKRREMGSSVAFAGLHRNGSRFSADVALNPIRWENYPPSHILAFVRDVTHLRRLEIAERELLDKTLLGVVTTLNSLMSITSPLIFDRTQSIRALVSHMASRVVPKELWQYQLAAALCLIGCVTIPPDVFERFWSGAKLSEEEDRIFRSHPAVGEKLLAPIERLEDVAQIVGRQLAAAESGSGTVEFGVSLLQVAQQADRLLYRNTPLASMIKQLRLKGGPRYPEDLLVSLADYAPPPGVYEVKLLRLGELHTGMILEEDLSTDSGLLIAPKQTVINFVLIERIRNFSHSAGVHEPFRVRCPASGQPVV
jgi:PAS domain S-box-containing protein